MKCKTGEQYDVDQLQVSGWTEGDGTGHEGYDAWAYFADGVYKGPDEHGIEPLFCDDEAAIAWPID